MKTKKIYPLNQSPLYKLKSKRKLAELIGVDVAMLKSIASGESYQKFINNKDREIQYPVSLLAVAHKKIAKYFSAIKMPVYVTSKQGSSYIKNALHHKGPIPVIKTDITKFYPSTSFGYIVRMFSNVFKCSPDVAWILAKICCYQGRCLPTGSFISGYIAFFANQEMFDEIYSLTKEYSCTLTCYVDDIVISAENANPTLLKKVRHIITRYGYTTKDKKSIYYSATQPKRITGCIIKGSEILLPNSRHLKIKRLRDALLVEKCKEKRAILTKELNGRLIEAKQVNNK